MKYKQELFEKLFDEISNHFYDEENFNYYHNPTSLDKTFQMLENQNKQERQITYENIIDFDHGNFHTQNYKHIVITIENNEIDDFNFFSPSNISVSVLEENNYSDETASSYIILKHDKNNPSNLIEDFIINFKAEKENFILKEQFKNEKQNKFKRI